MKFQVVAFLLALLLCCMVLPGETVGSTDDTAGKTKQAVDLVRDQRQANNKTEKRPPSKKGIKKTAVTTQKPMTEAEAQKEFFRRLGMDEDEFMRQAGKRKGCVIDPERLKARPDKTGN